ncbi:hypothetical protein SteCoe_6887 [Stentor coeruleus]|uniref:Aromatic amino acid beta-eliminating lyase/threonine aldolase domain-containing protein n=1 Tax=Stentor coeruleus TaxID=5963 RepID=A0A1R2CP00_9CILI|nr:hypothetical protein SteCoe_6887 [Stentor coeruleus]
MKAVKRIVDLRSDTVTKFSESMLQALVKAEVGDDVYHDDPGVNQLQERVAKMMGKEKGLFTVSGTMSNLLSILSHCKRGESAVLGTYCHINAYEQGNIASIAGVMPMPVNENSDGTFDFDVLATKILPPDQHFTKTTLITFENTHNKFIGKALPFGYDKKVSEFAVKHGVKTHLDGSRLLNAYYYHKERNPNIKEKDLTEGYDSICMCFTKGLRCPIGSVLVGTDEFIAKAHRWRKALGGGFRQIGYIAAAAMQSLDEAETIFTRDHKLASMLHRELINAEIKCEPLETNFVNYWPKTDLKLPEYVARLKDNGILVGGRIDGSVRMVCHAGVNEDDVELIVSTIRSFQKNDRNKN